MFTLFIATVIALGFAGLNISRYVFAGAPPANEKQLAAGINRTVIRVAGMSCATCEIAVRHALRRVNGVTSAQVSVRTNTATVDFDSSKTNPDQLVAAINSTGYPASHP